MVMKRRTKKVSEDIDRAIGSKVRRARVELGMSQEKLGLAVDLTFQQIQKYEKGTNRISTSMLMRLCAVLDKPFEFFIDVKASTPAHAECDTLLGIPEGRDLVKMVAGFSRSNLKTLLSVASAMQGSGA